MTWATWFCWAALLGAILILGLEQFGLLEWLWNWLEDISR